MIDDMSTDNDHLPTLDETSEETGSKGKSWKTRLILFFVVMALLFGGAYTLYLNLLDSEFFSDAGETTVIEELIQDNRSLTDRLGKLEEQLNKVLEHQGLHGKAIKDLQGSSGGNRTRWAIVEAERLLVVANHRLHLAKDIDAAIAALRTADQQLRALSHPRLLEVRKILAKEIKTLESLERLDVVGLTSGLQAIQGDVQNLPLAVNLQKNSRAQGDKPGTDARPEDVQQHKSISSLGEIWADIKGLVNIRDDVKVDQRLLSPEKSFFVRENLKLSLSGAQHTLLTGDAPLFKHQIGQVIQLIDDYFDLNNGTVMAARKQLLKMASIKAGSKWPEIDGSLKLLRKIGADIS